MKFNRGPTWPEYKRQMENWHPFFALIPRQVGDNDCRWLEWIERKGRFHYVTFCRAWWEWEYRAKQ